MLLHGRLGPCEVSKVVLYITLVQRQLAVRSQTPAPLPSPHAAAERSATGATPAAEASSPTFKGLVNTNTRTQFKDDFYGARSTGGRGALPVLTPDPTSPSVSPPSAFSPPPRPHARPHLPLSQPTLDCLTPPSTV